MIELENVSFYYANTLALKDINLKYDSKDFLTIIGPNGGGKSTLIRLILGLLKPACGEVRVFGKDPSKEQYFLSYVPQQIPLNYSFPMSVLDVALMGRLSKKTLGFYNKDDKLKALEALKKVGVSEFAKRRINDLSGGQRQRVYIARALCANAKIIILDEPTASIDIKGQTEIYSLLKGLNQTGIGVIMISHDINVAINYATKVAHVNKILTMHDVNFKDDFLTHLSSHKDHFCDVELILGECSCKN